MCILMKTIFLQRRFALSLSLDIFVHYFVAYVRFAKVYNS